MKTTIAIIVLATAGCTVTTDSGTASVDPAAAIRIIEIIRAK